MSRRVKDAEAYHDKNFAHPQYFQHRDNLNTAQTSPTMPKRKRSSPPPAERPKAAPLARQLKYCTKAIAAAQKPLLAGIKRGATIERQKTSRRKKYATSKNDEKGIYRINAEYDVLKALNLEQLADQHLRKTLARVTSLKNAAPLQEYIAGIREMPHDTNTLNVTARIFKTPAVKKTVDGLVAELKGILGVGGGEEKAQDRKKEESKKPEQKAKKAKVEKPEDTDMKDVVEEDDPYTAFSARIAEPSSGEDDSEASVSGDERPPSIGDSENEHEPEDDLEAGGTSSDSDSDSDSDSEDSDAESDIPLAFHKSLYPRSDVSSPASDSESDSDSESAPIPRTKPLKAVDLKSGTSAFIPTLSHAAYYSNSESEASDIDEAPRKNRRGQRARQKIAEAKFGTSAKHLEKAAQNVKWDPKRGAVSSQKRGKPVGRGPVESGGNAEPLGGFKKEDKKVVKRERDDKGELHPSWQAAKLVKESKKLVISKDGAGALGKKVVFD
jgi:hypothetical protein